MSHSNYKTDYIEVDELGEVKTKFQSIYDEIVDILEEKLEEIEEYNSNHRKGKTIKQSTIRDNLYLILVKHPLLSNEEAYEIEENELIVIFEEFVRLITKIGEMIESNFNCDKPLFCEYMGITLTAYDFLLKNGKERQKAQMERIDAYLYAKKQNASEEGELNSKSVASGVGTRYYGHSATVATDEGEIIKKVVEKTPLLTQKEIANIQSLFMIDNKK